MKRLLLATAFMMSMSLSAFAGPKEDAAQVIDQFKKAFDASDVQAVVSLFAPDAIFLGTVSPIVATKTEQIDKYFQGLTQLMPRSFTVDVQLAIVLSETAVLFTRFDTFTQTKDGQIIVVPARFTFLITKGDQGWRIRHFHSSLRPKPQ